MHEIRTESEFRRIYETCDPSSLSLAEKLFFPDLTEVAGSVLLSEALDDEAARARFLEAKATPNVNLQELEESFNFVEVPYLFAPSKPRNQGQSRI